MQGGGSGIQKIQSNTETNISKVSCATIYNDEVICRSIADITLYK